MEQDQESSTTSPATTRLTLHSIASVSFDTLPELHTNTNQGPPQSKRQRQPSTCPPMRRREVSFDVSYDAHPVRSRSGGGATTPSSDREGTVCDIPSEEDLTKRPAWVPDREAPKCHQCVKGFTFFRRRHHCRACGGVFCAACSSNRITIPRLQYNLEEVRVCDHCWVREAELRYRKPSGRKSSRRPRRQSLSQSSEIEINKHLLKRSLRGLATDLSTDPATTDAVEEGTSTERRARSEDAELSHERKEDEDERTERK